MKAGAYRGALGGKAILVGVAGDGSDAMAAEVEGRDLDSAFHEEGHNEAAETAVHMETDAGSLSNRAQLGNVVDDAVRIGGS